MTSIKNLTRDLQEIVGNIAHLKTTFERENQIPDVDLLAEVILGRRLLDRWLGKITKRIEVPIELVETSMIVSTRAMYSQALRAFYEETLSLSVNQNTYTVFPSVELKVKGLDIHILGTPVGHFAWEHAGVYHIFSRYRGKDSQPYIGEPKFRLSANPEELIERMKYSHGSRYISMLKKSLKT